MRAAVAAAFALVGFLVGVGRLSDNSFFVHLRTGRLILESGIPRSDPYSFTAPGVRWVAQSWLVEALYGVLDHVGGAYAIRVLGGLLGAGIAVGAFALASRLSGEVVRAALLSAAALLCLFSVWAERPLLFGVALMVVAVWVVELPSSWVGQRPLVVLPIVLWLWANMHGSFALGFLYLGLHVAGRWLDGAPPWLGRERALVGAAALGLVAAFVNPYGPALVVFPVRLLQQGPVLRHVVEWSSPDFHRPSGLALAIWGAVFVGVVALARTRPTRRDLLVTVPFLGLSLWALRNAAIAPLIGLPVAARLVAVQGARSARRSRHALSALIVVAAAMGAIAIAAAAEPDYRLDDYPVRAMDAVERAGLLGRRLVASDRDGGYLVLRYGGAPPVFVDDRYDMYPRHVVQDYLTLAGGRPGWQDVLGRARAEVVVWDARAPLAQLLARSPRWTLLHRDARFVVYGRDTAAGATGGRTARRSSG